MHYEVEIQSNFEECVELLDDSDEDVQAAFASDSQIRDFFGTSSGDRADFTIMDLNTILDHQILVYNNDFGSKSIVTPYFQSAIRTSNYLKSANQFYDFSSMRNMRSQSFYDFSTLILSGITILALFLIFFSIVYVIHSLQILRAKKLPVDEASISLSQSNVELKYSGRAPDSWLGGRGIHSLSSKDIDLNSLQGKFQCTAEFEQNFSSVPKIDFSQNHRDSDGDIKDIISNRNGRKNTRGNHEK
eukprot:CAMPEP_0115044688 /NCGR_PEP_ID=MMETSP0216-20121206/47669_1 /TAXON_ID=223996 /ORGANISM="Protocruzia adherens, Strain Boccale" /LENGTH=244 /DNA_ID=CAMNT_0002427359 /DNA_START=807 /DNA_END=1541 /DNA_ORIENTATION=-